MYEWNFELIYKSNEDFFNDFNALDEAVNSIVALKGKLNEKEAFYNYLGLNDSFELLIEKVFVYANMKKDLNQKDQETYNMFMKVYNKYLDAIGKLSFVEPEILEIGEEIVLGWLENDYAKYMFPYKKLFRRNKYVLDGKSEGLMANYDAATSGFTRLYDNLAIVDNYSTNVTLSDGSVIEVTNSNFRSYLEALANQDDRRLVFEAIFSYYEKHKATFAGIYDGIISSELAEAKSRGYESILDMRLFNNNIDKNVLLSLINTARGNSSLLKEYLAIRKDFFKLDAYHTYDRFLQFAKSNNKYTYDESKRLVLEALKNLGDDFYQKALAATADGRISVYPQDGKTTGAYSNGMYNNGPFILLNHTDRLNDAFTLAHEAGHSIHTMYANEAQPKCIADYQIFVAEVASTFNEHAFLDYMLEKSTDKNEKLVLLQSAIDGLIGTFYRQVTFADIEYQAHKLKEEGNTLSYEMLGKITKDIYLDYYGIDLNNERYKEFVWAYIPHLFHSPFYVYQYATSYAASLAFYNRVKAKEDGAFIKYVNMLKAGGSDYPVEIIKAAGVDLTTTEPFMAVVKRLEFLIAELKKLI